MIRALAVAMLAAAAALAAAPMVGTSLAHPHSYSTDSETTLIPLGGGIALERTSLSFVAPADGSLPWGFVEGTVENPAAGHPVLIEISQGGEPVRWAQVELAEDGSFEHRFRVMDSGVPVFSGVYDVTIFKVVGANLGAQSA